MPGYGRARSYKGLPSGSALESAPTEGDRPVCVGKPLRDALPSTVGLVEPGPNLSRPRDKAKYGLATDSAKVTRVKDEKYGC